MTAPLAQTSTTFALPSRDVNGYHWVRWRSAVKVIESNCRLTPDVRGNATAKDSHRIERLANAR